MNRDASLGAWYGDSDLKAEVMARMLDHRAKDEIVRGTYQTAIDDGRYKGCAIGCTLPWMDRRTFETWHDVVRREYAIPNAVAVMIDDTFEMQETFESAAEFAIAVISNIPVGADLDQLDEEIWICTEGPEDHYADVETGSPNKCWACTGTGAERAEEFIKRLAAAPITMAAAAQILAA